mmetsp:Transcript_789/g.2842  ORF Transcript_789/g.2842 Transcript_789/m.2842 type:complete len:286 (-) Transcript_789:103-960(-)
MPRRSPPTWIPASTKFGPSPPPSTRCMSSSAANTTCVRQYPSLTPRATRGGDASGDSTHNRAWKPPTAATARTVFGKCRLAIALGSTRVSSHSGSEDQPARTSRREGRAFLLPPNDADLVILRRVVVPVPVVVVPVVPVAVPPFPASGPEPSERTSSAPSPLSLSSLHASSSAAALSSLSTKSSSGVRQAVDLRNAPSSSCIDSVRSSTVLTHARPGLAVTPAALVSSNPAESADLARCRLSRAVYGRYTGRRHTRRQNGSETSESATASTIPSGPSCADRARRQ